MMLGSVLVIVLIEFFLSALFSSYSMTVNGYPIMVGSFLALFMAGYVGGLRFCMRQMRPMKFSELVICTLASYCLIVLIPLLLLTIIAYSFGDNSELTAIIFTQDELWNLLVFVTSYLAIDVAAFVPILFSAIWFGQLGQSPGRRNPI